MDWNFVQRTWEKWASANVGSAGKPLKSALLLNYDPTGPSRLLSTIAKQEGIKADPLQLGEFVNFVKREKFRTETFFIGENEYLVTTVHENWFSARSINMSKPDAGGIIVMQTTAFIFVSLYDGCVGLAPRAMAAADQFVWQLSRKNL